MKILTPGKTFLVGEYLALQGGPSLLVTTGPDFSWTYDSTIEHSGKRDPDHALRVHPDSPVAKLLADSDARYAFSDFSDPYHGAGGLGASTAQYLSLMVAPMIHSENRISAQGLKDILIRYRRHATGVTQKSPPSGADLVAQLVGGVVAWDENQMRVTSWHNWNFKELGFVLVRTGEKLATHEHLNAEIHAPIESLRTLAQAAVAAFASGDETEFAESIAGYGRALRASGLQSPRSISLVDEILSDSHLRRYGHVLAAKGCGAMGADIILALYRKQGKASLLEWLQQRHLTIVASEVDVSGYGCRAEFTDPSKTLRSWLAWQGEVH